MIIFGYVTKIQLPGIIFVLEQHNICQSLSMVQYLLLSRLMAVIFLSVRKRFVLCRDRKGRTETNS